MATNTVGSTGDYATLSAWEAAVQGTSDATEIAELQSEDHANDAAADISGWTNTPDVTIRGVDAQDGDFGTGARFNRSSGGFAIVCSESDVSVTVEDVAMTITGGFYVGILTGTDGATYSNALRFGLSRCMVKSNDNFGCSAATLNARSTTISAANRIGLDIENCVFVDFTSSSNALELGYSGAGRQNLDVVIRGTTFYESKITLGSNHGDSTSAITARGCLWKTPGSSDALVDETGSGTYSFTSDGCILDESSATHTADWDTSTNNSYSVTFNDSGTPSSGEVSFTDAANDDYSLVDDSNNLAIDFVTSGRMPAADILGETRDSNPDAGAFEIASAGGVEVTPSPWAGTWDGNVPTIENDVAVTPSPWSGTYTVRAPDVGTTEHVEVSPAPWSGTYSPLIPVVELGEHVNVTPGPASGTYTPLIPVVEVGEHVRVTPAPWGGTWDGEVPVIQVGDNVVVTPDAWTGTWEGRRPDVGVPVDVTPDPWGGTYTPLAPEVGSPLRPDPFAGTWAGAVPSIATANPVPVITHGSVAARTMDAAPLLEPGDELVVRLEGPSATDPRVRVRLVFGCRG